MHNGVQRIGPSEEQAGSLHASGSFAEVNQGTVPAKTDGEGLDLTQLEKQILTLTMAGYSLPERAGLLGLGQHTLRLCLLKICERFKVEGEFELMLFAVYHKLLDACEISPPGESKIPVNV